MEDSPGHNGCPAGQRPLWISWSARLLGSILFRLTVSHGIWALLHWRTFQNIYEMAQQWEIYYIALTAPFLCWHGAILYYQKSNRRCRGLNGNLVFLSIGLSLSCFLTPSSNVAATLFALGSLLALRISMTKESLSEVMSAGGMTLLFMIPWPLDAFESIANMLCRIYAAIAFPLTSVWTGMPIEVLGSEAVALSGASIDIARECSGFQSLMGLALFSTYFSNLKQQKWILQMLVCLGAIEFALLLNFIRVMFSCIFVIAHNVFWGGKAGHELLGLILMVLGLVLVRALARDVSVPLGKT